jgi:hypothetical protein
VRVASATCTSPLPARPPTRAPFSATHFQTTAFAAAATTIMRGARQLSTTAARRGGQALFADYEPPLTREQMKVIFKERMRNQPTFARSARSELNHLLTVRMPRRAAPCPC